MGSLNDSQPITQKDRVVRHNGAAIIVSETSSDGEFVKKFEKSYADKLKQLEDSIRSMPSRVAWLDASDESTVVINDDNEVTRWDDKSGNGIKADDSDGQNRPKYTKNAISINGRTLNAIRFLNDDNLSLGQQLDSEIVGAGKSWTMIMAVKPIDSIVGSWTFRGIINKFDSNDFSFYIYIFDYNAGAAVFRTELYAGNSLNNGANVRGGVVDLRDKPRDMLVLTSIYNAAGGQNSERIDQYINRTQDIANPFEYGTGMGDITDNNDALTIGRYSGGDISGFGYSSYDGYFCELLIFNKPLNEEERTLVEHYLGLKWGASNDMSDLRSGAE